MKRKRAQPQPTVTMEHTPAPDATQRLRRAYDVVLKAATRAKEQPSRTIEQEAGG